MSLRSYILALIAIPLIALIIVGGLKGISDFTRLTSARDTKIEVGHVLASTNLAHFLQVERGKSAVFLSSKGSAFGEDLAKTRLQVDAAASQVPSSSKDLHSALARLNEIRATVDSHNLTAPEMGAFFTAIIAESLDEAEREMLHQTNPQIVKMASGLVALSAAKESAGQQRASGATGFGIGQFELSVYRGFAEKGATEAQFLHVAKIALAEDVPGLDFTKVLQDSGLKGLRDSVIAAGPGPSPAGITGPEWFQIATNWITYLHEVELMVTNGMTELATIEARDALINLAITAIVFFLAVVGCVGIGLRLIRIFDTQFGALQEDLDRLARNDFAFRPTFMKAKTEIGRLNRAMEITRSALEQAEASRAATEADRTAVIDRLDRRLARFADRDLDCVIEEKFPAEYEQLRKSFNATVTTLSATVQKVIEASGSIRSGAHEISQASDDLSRRTESQAATLEQTAAALEELTNSVKSAADGSRNVAAIMGQARQEAESSGEVVRNAVSAMTEIEQSSNHIAQIISVINDIAFQTNLLALNAGVEAARAGEAGRGFAIVASEVRGLAQRSAEAATEINNLISDSSKQVKRGVTLVGKAGEALDSIAGRVNHISKLVSEIAEGAAAQSTGLGEINTAVVQLDQVTQQNSAMVEQTTAAGHTLSSDASQLADLVAQFKISGGNIARVSVRHNLEKPKSSSFQGGNSAGKSSAPASAKTAVSGQTSLNVWQAF